MHTRVNDTYQKLAEKYELKGPFLEIGVGHNDAAILSGRYFLGKPQRFATNLSNMEIIEEQDDAKIQFVRCNSNNMRDVFTDGQFGTILSNAVIEHDKYFWRSLDEMKRILAPGGILAIGAPAYLPRSQLKTDVISDKLGKATVTMDVHSAPDYWRFSRMAFKEVICEGLELLEMNVVLRVPVLVAIARKPLDGLLPPVAQENRMIAVKAEKEAKLLKRGEREERIKARESESGAESGSSAGKTPAVERREARQQARDEKVKAREAKAGGEAPARTGAGTVKPRAAKLEAREAKLKARKEKSKKTAAETETDEAED